MSITKKLSGMAVHMIVLALTVCLVTGLAGFDNNVYATSSSGSPFANTKSSYLHNGRFDGNLIVHGVDVSYYQAVGSDWNKAKNNKCDYLYYLELKKILWI